MRMDAIPDPIDRTGWKDWKRRKRRAGESKEHIFFFFRCSQVRARTLHAYRRVSFLRPLQAVSHLLSATTLGGVTYACRSSGAHFLLSSVTSCSMQIVCVSIYIYTHTLDGIIYMCRYMHGFSLYIFTSIMLMRCYS